MRICVRATAARTHSWMARYGSSDTAATPSIPSSRVKPIALVDARNRNRPSEAPNRHGYYPRTLPASRTTYRRSATAKAGSVRECQRTSAPISDASTIPCAGTKTECSRRAARCAGWSIRALMPMVHAGDAAFSTSSAWITLLGSSHEKRSRSFPRMWRRTHGIKC